MKSSYGRGDMTAKTLIGKQGSKHSVQGKNMKKCPYCESGTNDFVRINQDIEFTGIEMSLDRFGELRVRTYTNTDDYFDSQSIIEIKYCPFCGKRFR